MDDLLFKNRNKEYGAYKLRKQYNKTLALSLFVSVIFVLLVVLVPFILNIKNQYNEDFVIRTNIVAAELMPIEQFKADELKPQSKIEKPNLVNKPEEKNEIKADSVQKNKNNTDSALAVELKKRKLNMKKSLLKVKPSFQQVPDNPSQNG